MNRMHAVDESNGEHKGDIPHKGPSERMEIKAKDYKHHDECDGETYDHHPTGLPRSIQG